MDLRADHLLLCQTPVTDTAVREALRYYVMNTAAAPVPYAHVFMACLIAQMTLLGTKVVVGSESNVLFDGASLFLVLASCMLCYARVQPNLDGVQGATTAQQAFGSLREIASSHAVISVALLGIILLQSGKYYSQRLQERERNEELDARLQRRLRQQQQQERKAAEGAGARVPLPSDSA